MDAGNYRVNGSVLFDERDVRTQETQIGRYFGGEEHFF